MRRMHALCIRCSLSSFFAQGPPYDGGGLPLGCFSWWAMVSRLKFSGISGGVRAVACVDTGSDVYGKIKSSVFVFPCLLHSSCSLVRTDGFSHFVLKPIWN